MFHNKGVKFASDRRVSLAQCRSFPVVMQVKLRNRLKYWRHMNQMEQSEFAEFLGVTRQQYNTWERHRKEPNLETAWRIAKRLQINLEELFNEAEG